MRVVFAALLLLPPAARAAEQKPAYSAEQKTAPAPLTTTQQLDKLFADLAKADSEDDAQPIQTEIEALFLQSGSPTVDLLMSRGQSALQSGDTATARKVYDSVTRLAPDFAEGWHMRAQLQEAAGDDEGALLSLQKAIALNPREFNALSHLADMLDDYGDKKGALAAYRKVLALDPKNDDVNRAVRKLSREVEGEKI
jgi:tetratricopeptide (TPR) repeat protein